MERQNLVLEDGRVLEYVVGGDPDGRPVVIHGGSPSAADLSPEMVEWAVAHHVWLISYSRPGYGASTPRPGRNIAQAADDVAALTTHLGIDQFATLGASAGAPHALATAARLPGRVHGVAAMMCPAPVDAAGLDWTAGMSPMNVMGFAKAREGREALHAYLQSLWDAMRASSAGPSTADAPAQDAEMARLMANVQHALSQGLDGWIDDALAMDGPWGFSLADFTADGPAVHLYAGDADDLVPVAHTRWIAEHIAGSHLTVYPGETHLTLPGRHLLDILGQLANGQAE